MKTKRFRLLTVLLAVVMMFALSIQAYAATSKPVTQDGITATLVTDKDSYKAGESVNATVKIENNSGQDVFVFTQITVPSTVKLTGASAFDAVLANGQAWTSAAGVLSGTAGTTATGDNMQAGLWTVVSILAIGGAVALLVYGKNRKTWVSMMLCVVMIGGLMAAAVPAQAAGVSGSMSVSCAIQVDGKAAEVTAVVNYIVGYEAGSVTTTTPSETPSEAPTTAPSEEPTEAPTTTPSEDPTVAPTTVPTEAPTEIPTEVPTETPTETPTQTPEEGDTPSEAGYYVVWDDFNFANIGNAPATFSSWDVALPTETLKKATDGGCFADSTAYAKGVALRTFNAITQDFTTEFTIKINGTNVQNTVVDLGNSNSTGIRFIASNNKLFLNNEELCELPTSSFANLKLHISPQNGTFTISVNGNTVKNGDDIKEFSFVEQCTSIDRFRLETGKEDVVSVTIGTLRVYTGFYVNEKFLDGTEGKINDEWTVTGDATTIFKQGTQGKDNYNAILKNESRLERNISYEQDGAWVEFQQLMEENVGEFVITLADDAGNVFKVATKDGNFGYYNGNEFVGLYDCVANLWYHVMIKQTDAGTEIYLNHKQKNLKDDEGNYELITLPFDKFTNISFTMTGGEAMLDDIIVKDWIPLPEDYVPEPVAVEKEEGATLVGLQSCNLWVEGEHFGYDWLTDWEERTPVLGYYDEMTPETADWELKFKVEHGIDFELFCWYRPDNGNNQPIKMARNSRALHDGYMNAEYSDMMKFAITWETAGSVAGLEDFKNNVIPYWIEQYFKDDRYLVLDGKPVVGMYNFGRLSTYFGGSNGVKAALDSLREACIDAGFEGAYIIICNSSASSAVGLAELGFDGQYAYTWGSVGDNVSAQTNSMESIQQALVDGQMSERGIIPVVTQGFWDKPWGRNDGNYCGVETYEAVLKWVRDTFMPTLDSDSLGSKMILLDNWNEYGEGHFIMPAELAGFGYLDAVREVFGDGNGADGSHTSLDIVPNEAQLERINHMYIQDRHVVLVDKESDAQIGELEAIEGCDWKFDETDNWEGWTIAPDAGNWIKRLAIQEVKDGVLHGKTYLPSELASGETADPSILSPDNLDLRASEIVAVKMRMKAIGGVSDVGAPELFWATTTSPSFSSGSKVSGTCEESTDGYVDITFYVDDVLNAGTIKQIRIDPIQRDGEFWIDSIQIVRRKDAGDTELYLNEERVYTSLPIVKYQDTYMIAAEELSSLVGFYVGENLVKDCLYVYGNDVLFEFSYADAKMQINGVMQDDVGLVEIEGVQYIPIVAVFENLGVVYDGEGIEHPAYTIIVTPATENEKNKISITKYVDKSILASYYFEDGTEGWTYGGAATPPASDGAGCLTSTATDASGRIWSPESKYFGVNNNEATHVRLRVKTNAVNTTKLNVIIYGDGVSYSGSYNVLLDDTIKDDNGFYTVLLNLSKASGLKNASKIDRARISWYTEGAGTEQTMYLDSFEILQLENSEDDDELEELLGDDTGKWTEGDATYESLAHAAYFNGNSGVWGIGGSTSLEMNSGLMDITAGDRGGARVWWNQLNVAPESFDTFRVRIRAGASENHSVQIIFRTASKQGNDLLKSVNYQTDENGWAIVEMDVSDLIEGMNGEALTSLGLYPTGASSQVGDRVSVDYVEFLKKKDVTPDLAGDDTGKWTEGDATYESLAHATYFTGSNGAWERGGSTSFEINSGLMDITAGDRGGARVWWNQLNVAPESFDTFRVRIRAGASENHSVQIIFRTASKQGNELLKSVNYQTDENGWAIVEMDVSDLIEGMNGEALTRLGLYPTGASSEVGDKVSVDYVEFLKKKN